MASRSSLTTPIAVRVPNDLMDRLRAEAERTDVSLTAVVVEALRRRLDGGGGDDPREKQP